MRSFHWTVATWFGSGLSPFAPGTMGSLATLPLAWMIAYFLPQSLDFVFFSLSWHLPIAIVLFFLALPSVQFVIKDSGKKDPQMVVIDETVGQLLTFAFIPPTLLLNHIWIIALGFVFFRILDINKPFGIRKLESLPSAWGVMADDLLGGFYAGIWLATLAYFFKN